LRVFCGIDWAEDHHDVALVDVDGKLIAKRRISDDAAGFTLLLELFAEAGDSVEEPMPVAIETGRGLLVACLRATGRQVFAINPMAVSRYRDRHSVARKKSDAGDALMLAHILRTDMAAHRSLPADSELAQAIAVLARAQQDAVWDRTCAHNKLRSLLREYYPAILAAFADKRDGLLRPHPPRARRSPGLNCALPSNVPVASAASMPKPPVSRPRYGPRSYDSCRWSRTPSVAKLLPCCECWTQPA
jgi:transposase